jgi:tripartite-type tricarboxylate transporter receptor subunit TctC
MLSLTKLASALLLASSLLSLQAPGWAQAYPHKQLHLVVPFPPGAGTDMFARVVASKLGESMGQQVIVDNKPGGGATIGTEFVARSAPDGYTLLISTASHAINPSVFPKLPYDTLKDFASVAELATVPIVLVVNPSVPAHSVKELVELAKAAPGKLSIGSSSNGTVFHLAGELFKSRAGIDMVHIPYKGGGPALIALLGGQIDVLFETSLTVQEYAKAGKLRILAVGSEQRVPSMPDVPTLAESGFPGFAAENWYGIYAPAGTPREIVMKLNHEIVKALNLPDVKERFASQGAVLVGNTPEQQTYFLKAEMEKWKGIARLSHATVD